MNYRKLNGCFPKNQMMEGGLTGSFTSIIDNMMSMVICMEAKWFLFDWGLLHFGSVTIYELRFL